MGLGERGWLFPNIAGTLVTQQKMCSALGFSGEELDIPEPFQDSGCPWGVHSIHEFSKEGLPFPNLGRTWYPRGLYMQLAGSAERDWISKS